MNKTEDGGNQTSLREDQNTHTTRSMPIKGRGAVSNPHNRFAHHTIEEFYDGWSEEADTVGPATTLIRETTRNIVSTNKSPDVPFEKSINPYRGCEHGCIYCYARPTHAYWDMSPGLDFESKIIIKPNAAQLLRDTLTKPGYKPSVICIGANTDPYQPSEAKVHSTRRIIEVLQEFRHPFTIITRSGLIRRDLDILADMAALNLCSVAISVTTLENDLKRKLEPRAPYGRTRLATIESLSRRGIPVTLMVAPMIPYVNDHEMEQILRSGSAAGVSSARYIFIRLPREVHSMFEEWLATHFPERAAKVMNVIKASRGGRAYDSDFETRMRGTGNFADLLGKRFQLEARRLGLNTRSHIELELGLFTYPGKQLSLI